MYVTALPPVGVIKVDDDDDDDDKSNKRNQTKLGGGGVTCKRLAMLWYVLQLRTLSCTPCSSKSE